ncbi:MAG: DNA repair protein RecO [Candidatus Omnitrophica bacterium]|nr:DNA repair protein RecO [Candidatus Omnitrophota bacterium]
MALTKSLALVIRFRPYRETSVLFVGITPEYGTLHFLGKGFRETLKGFMAPFEPMTLLDVVFYERSRAQLQLLKEISEIEHFPNVRQEARTYALACHFADVVDQLPFGGERETAIFKLLIEALRRIGDPALDLECLSAAFKAQVLALAGFGPQLYRCVGCRAEDLNRSRFAYEQGGVVCLKCAVRMGGTLPLSFETLKAFRQLIRQSFEEALLQKMSLEIVLGLRRILDRFISYRLETDLKTRRVLSQLRVR